MQSLRKTETISSKPTDTIYCSSAIALHRKTNTNPNPDPNRYRRRCPDPIARIQKFIHFGNNTTMGSFEE